MDNRSSMTALMSAFARAYHFKTEKQPVFADSAAEKLMTMEEYEGKGKYILSGIDFSLPSRKESCPTARLSDISLTHSLRLRLLRERHSARKALKLQQ